MKKTAPIQSSVEKMILFLPRRRLSKASASKLKAALYALEQCRITRSTFAKHNSPDGVVLYDACRFCIMYIADLTVLTRDMCCTSGRWQSRLYGRLLAMTMLECAEDIPSVLGKQFREALFRVTTEAKHTDSLMAVSKGLSTFRKLYETDLRYIRQIAGAHRDHDPQLIENVIEKLDVWDLAQKAQELTDQLDKFAKAMTKVLQEMNILKEVLKGFPHKKK